MRFCSEPNIRVVAINIPPAFTRLSFIIGQHQVSCVHCICLFALTRTQQLCQDGSGCLRVQGRHRAGSKDESKLPATSRPTEPSAWRSGAWLKRVQQHNHLSKHSHVQATALSCQRLAHWLCLRCIYNLYCHVPLLAGQPHPRPPQQDYSSSSSSSISSTVTPDTSSSCSSSVHSACTNKAQIDCLRLSTLTGLLPCCPCCALHLPPPSPSHLSHLSHCLTTCLPPPFPRPTRWCSLTSRWAATGMLCPWGAS